MESLILKNCKEIVTQKDGFKRGNSMKNLVVEKNKDIGIKDGKIFAIGNLDEKEYDKVIDASKYVITPGFIDSHTHLVFGGSREKEFIMRVRGESYENIAKAGGGIKNSVSNTRRLSEDELFELADERIKKVFASGTTTVEIKSGYGLDSETELKMLRVIKRLKEKYPDSVVSTFLGPHEIPEGYSEEGYIEHVCKEMLPKVKAENLAEFADIFTEKGVFSLKTTEKYLLEAKKMGFKLKMHADELYPLGGAELGAKMGAVSVDHLMKITSQGIKALSEKDTVATILPGTSFFLMMKDYAPARTLIENNAIVALASDYNPGSSNGFNLQIIMNLAALQLKMEPEEIITSVTVNAAKALDLDDRGTIEVGKKADILLLDIPNYYYLVYQYGYNVVKKVIKNGRLFLENETVISSL